VYSIPFFLVYFFGHLLFDMFNLFYPYDGVAISEFKNNSIAMLCSVVECVAAIVAIVVSLTK
jgi:hypothetical protein